jgi:hypothetical protein
MTTTTTTTTAPSSTTTTPAPTASPLGTATDPRERAAYDAILPLARALPEKDLIALNLDVPEVISKSLAVYAAMQENRTVLAALPRYDIDSLDGLESAALALAAAHGACLAATLPPDQLATLIEQGTQLRRSLLNWSIGLADAGIVNGAMFEKAPMGNGFLDIATGLTTLVMAYRSSNWVAVKDNSALTDAMLVDAESLSQRIHAQVGYRNLGPARVAEAADLRVRFFTICVNRYDQIRRAVTFLRWSEGDVDELVPSLYLRPHKKPAQDGTNATLGNAPAQGQPASPQHPASPAAPSPSATTAPRVPGAPGTPDSSPFLTA